MQKLQEAKLLDDSIINFKCILNPSMLIVHTFSSVYRDGSKPNGIGIHFQFSCETSEE